MALFSSTLFDEHWKAGDERFLDELFSANQGKKLKAFADRFYDDARPFARRMLLRYIDDGCDRAHHRPLVKALFKRAEKAGDDEAMGHFLAAFDRFPRRRMGAVWSWNADTRTSEKAKVLVPDGSIPARLGNKESRYPRFSRRTRAYLCRRAFRYFRALARRDVVRYGRAARAALLLYRDAHLERPEQLLDAWGLVHLLYWGSPVISRDPRGARVAEGRSLAELEPAPFAKAAWDGATDAALDLVAQAPSRTVRVFAIALLRRDHAEALRGISLQRVRPFLRSAHEEVQTFAAELLRGASGVHNLSVEEWLELLRIDNPTALPLLCELVAKTVSPERLSLAQCVELACARPAPVAELGLRWARQKPIADAAALAVALGLCRAGVPGVRAEGAAWLEGLIEKAPFAAPEHVRTLVDARFADARAHGLALIDRDPRFREATSLWAALAETPYDDVRGFLVKHLGERQATLGPDTLRHVWATSLLAVHRGGRAKRAALDQIAARVARRPSEAEALLPLLAVALRSVRAPERRAAISAVATAVVRHPALGGAVARVLPELVIDPGAAG